ncbi:hypothetical protein P3L10_008470 [Capsicum annuum]
MKLSRKVDIPTRWNTTYDMLAGAMEHKVILTEAYNESIVVDADDVVDDIVIDDVVDDIVIDGGNGVRGRGDTDENDLTDINWIACEEIVNFLQKFHGAVTHFAGSYYPTCFDVAVEPKQAPTTPSSSAFSSKRFPGCEFWQQHVVMSHESRRSADSNELSILSGATI